MIIFTLGELNLFIIKLALDGDVFFRGGIIDDLPLSWGHMSVRRKVANYQLHINCCGKFSNPLFPFSVWPCHDELTPPLSTKDSNVKFYIWLALINHHVVHL